MEVRSHRKNSVRHRAKQEQRLFFSKVPSGNMLPKGLLFAAALAKNVEWREKWKFFLLGNSPSKASERAFLVNLTDLSPMALSPV